ncbi:MAG: ATP-binding protein [Candidatus Absconditabacterales bacterium]
MTTGKRLKDLQKNIVQLGNGQEVVKSVAIFGANASGKSNLLEALGSATEFILKGDRLLDADEDIWFYQPFLFDTFSENNPTSCEFEFVIDKILYHYVFSVIKKNVVSETLSYYPKNKEIVMFKRDGQHILCNKKHFQDNDVIGRVRPNVLALDKFARENSPQAANIIKEFFSKINVLERDERSSPSEFVKLMKEEKFEKFVTKLICSADLGIKKLSALKEEVPIEEIPDFIKERLNIKEDQKTIGKSSILAYHSVFNELNEDTGRLVGITFLKESYGTQAIISLAPLFYEVFTAGGLLLIDELDDSLHPLLFKQLVESMHVPNVEDPRPYQIIYTCHTPNVLSTSILRRDQIYLTNKSDSGESNIYSISSYKARKDKDLEKGYLDEKLFGGVPNLNSTLF